MSSEIIKYQLTYYGVDVKTFNAHSDGISYLKELNKSKQEVDMIIINDELDEVKGKEVGAVIRQKSTFEKTPMVMISGNLEPVEKVYSMLSSYSIDGLFGKPIKNYDLVEALKFISEVDFRKHEIFVTRHTIKEYYEEKQHKVKTQLNLRGYRILLVEDNFINQQVATTMIEKYGCRVTPAGNGKEAVDIVKNQDFDLIFMDCQMPEMDGYEATQTIRNYERDGDIDHTNIIALTANAMKGDKEKCMASGMDDYMSKPIRQEDMEDKLQRWLDPL